MFEQVPLPLGFRSAGVSCGIKGDASKYDLALFVSESPCSAAGVFTQNRVCGAPVKVSRERLPRGSARAVVINSGNSNACTGERGIQDARWMTEEVAGRLGCPAEDVLVCSTGIIGRFLPRDNLAAGIPQAFSQLAGTSQAFVDAAIAMMTTDTVHKQAARTSYLGRKEVRVTGCAKGAAMIAPNMATMLAVILTDAVLSPEDADRMLRHAVNDSFNCISVEGHTSTSDTVLLLANGAAGTGPLEPAEQQALQRMIDEVATELAQAIIRDAEGARHFVRIDVSGVRSREDAYRIAKSVADSPLVKTAIAGADPNWGRIVSAVGYSGVDLREENISLTVNGTLLYRDGAPVDFDAAAVSEKLRSSRDVTVDLRLNLGDSGCRFWTSDLTKEYVELNSDYTT